MAKEEFKSILERKTGEIRAFREELRKKSLEGIDSQFEVLQKRAGNLKNNSSANVQENKPAEEIQKGNNGEVKEEKPKVSKIPEKPNAVKKPKVSKIPKKPKAVKVIKRKIKKKHRTIKKQHKTIKKIDKVNEKKTAHTSKFGSEEAEIKRQLQEVLIEERNLSS